MKAEIQRSARITIRLRGFERGLIERASEADRCTLTEWVRDQVLRAARSRLDGPPYVAPGERARRS